VCVCVLGSWLCAFIHSVPLESHLVRLLISSEYSSPHYPTLERPLETLVHLTNSNLNQKNAPRWELRLNLFFCSIDFFFLLLSHFCWLSLVFFLKFKIVLLIRLLLKFWAQLPFSLLLINYPLVKNCWNHLLASSCGFPGATSCHFPHSY